MSFADRNKRRMKRFFALAFLLSLAFAMDAFLLFMKKFKKTLFFPGN